MSPAQAPLILETTGEFQYPNAAPPKWAVAPTSAVFNQFLPLKADLTKLPIPEKMFLVPFHNLPKNPMINVL
jgi:hypothetical protein